MPFKHPAYLILFFVLIVPLGVGAQSLGLGTDALFVCVLAAMGATVALPHLFRLLRAQMFQSLDGKPSVLDFLLGPPGHYRQLELKAPEEESIESTLQEVSFAPPPARRLPAPSRRSDTRLHLSADFTPDVDEIVGEGIVGFGSKGSGKTNLGALLAEQFGDPRFLIPMTIFDIEGDYLSLIDVLPRGQVAASAEASHQFELERLLVVDEHNAEEIGYAILDKGYQVIFALHTWENDVQRASIMVGIITGLTRWANEQLPGERVPCLLFLDEAARWLPQDSRLSNLDPTTLSALQCAFIQTATLGRKRGLTPVFFNQRIADLDKRVMAQANIYFLLKQRLDLDLSRYMQYVNAETLGKADAGSAKKVIAAFEQGQGIVSLADGTQFVTRFYERRSKHVSHTPKASDAFKRYGAQTRVLQETPKVTTPLEYEELLLEDDQKIYPRELPPERRRQKTPAHLTAKYERARSAWNEGHNSIRKLAKALGLTPGQARQLIDEMDRAGLIQKNEPDEKLF